MGVDEVAKLVEFTDRLVLEETGNHLRDVEQDVLRQVLEGKLLKQIHYGDYNNGYIQKFIARDLWKRLSQVTGKKVGKKNVKQILEKLQEKRSHSETPPQSQSPTNIQVELDGHLTFNGSVSYPQSPNGSTPAEELDSVEAEESPPPEASEAINGNTLNSDRASGTEPLPNEASETENPERQQAEDDSPDSASQRCQSSSESFLPNPGSSTRSRYDSMNFMKSGVPLLLSLGILGLSLGLSWLLNWYGVTNHLAGNLPKAQFFYALAHKLTPVSAATHYNRGAMYEEQQNYESARAEYQLAIEGGLIDAYNNQARLYILAGKYDRAIALLKTGLPLAREDSVKYTMLKNQGWARLEQGSYAQAKIDLQQAIALKKDESSAYCLLAQVLEGEGDREGAFAAWESCLGYSYQPKFPEEDQWIDMASQRLDALMK